MSRQNEILGVEQGAQNFISGPSGGGEGLAQPDKAYWSIWRAKQDFSIEIDGEGSGIIITDGGAGNPNSSGPTLTTYPWFEIQVPGGFRKYAGQARWFTGRKIILKGVLSGRWDVLGNSGAGTGSSADIWQGVTDIIAGGDVASAVGHTIAIGVLKQFGAPFTNVIILTNDGGAVTLLDTGFAINQSQRYQWKLVIQNGAATLFIDKIQIAVQNTLPATFIASTFWVLGGRSNTGSTFSKLEYMYTENAAP
jgi:hypothetical protein